MPWGPGVHIPGCLAWMRAEVLVACQRCLGPLPGWLNLLWQGTAPRAGQYAPLAPRQSCHSALPSGRDDGETRRTGRKRPRGHGPHEGRQAHLILTSPRAYPRPTLSAAVHFSGHSARSYTATALEPPMQTSQSTTSPGCPVLYFLAIFFPG